MIDTILNYCLDFGVHYRFLSELLKEALLFWIYWTVKDTWAVELTHLIVLT